jgi:hypothetical protein
VAGSGPYVTRPTGWTAALVAHVRPPPVAGHGPEVTLRHLEGELVRAVLDADRGASPAKSHSWAASQARRQGLVFVVADQVNEGDAYRKISHASAAAKTAQPTARKVITAARWRRTRNMRRSRTRAPVAASIATAQTKSISTTAITRGVTGRSPTRLPMSGLPRRWQSGSCSRRYGRSLLCLRGSTARQ